MHTHTGHRHLSPVLVTVISLVVIAGVSLFVRISLPYDEVFVDGLVWFKGMDAWYHMHLVDNLVHNFPQLTSFDPYTNFPDGKSALFHPLTDWLVAGTAQLVGQGAPSQHVVDIVGAFLPPILGTLIILPVYFIGKVLFNRWVGLLSAALVVLLPGELLNRSLLGFTDHHVAESLFSAVTILFLMLGVRSAKERDLTFTKLVRKNWYVIARPLIYAVLAGAFLGIYLLAWRGGLMLVFVISAYLAVQFIIDHLVGESTDYLCIVGVLSLSIGSVMLLPIIDRAGMKDIYFASLPIATLAPAALSGVSLFVTSKNIKRIYYPLVLVGLAAIALALLYVAAPSLLHSMLARFDIFAPSGAALTIQEVHPLLFPYGHFSLQIAWLNFNTSFFLSLISFVLILRLSTKDQRPDRILFLVWSTITLLAVMGQRRFGYYYTVDAALLTGYLCWRVLAFAAARRMVAPLGRPVVVKRKGKGKAETKLRERETHRNRVFLARLTLAAVAVFFVVFFPNIGQARAVATQPSYMSEGWYGSLVWLKDNSPEPLGDAGSYYELHDASFEYPESAYGIMSWWDYGHWVTRIAHRMPISNPFQDGASAVAGYFIAQDEDSANRIMNDLGAEYVIVDHKMPTTKFHAMPAFADSPEDKFWETYHRPTEGGMLEPVRLYYPAYYQSMVVRLYIFDGEAAVAEDPTVISYEERVTKEGVRYKRITDSKSFATYEAAADYLAGLDSGNCVLGSVDPLSPPVALEALQQYELVYESHAKTTVAGKKRLPEVKIFEYVSTE